MTQSEALQEARRRWGKLATAEYSRVREEYVVAPSFDTRWENVGMGDSWAAAFADADKKETSQ